MRELIEANFLKTGNSFGFLYAGTFHTLSPQVKNVRKQIIHADLREQARTYIDDKAYLDKAMSTVRLGLIHLLCEFQNAQEIRDYLPEIVVRKVPELNGIPRLRQPGWKDPLENKLHAHAIQQTIDTMEAFVINDVL